MATRPWLIVGLGNPGPAYTPTRHNAGERLLRALQASWGLPELRAEQKLEGEVSKGRFHHADVLLLFPTTFMNDSGRSVNAAAAYYRIPPDHMLVLHDDKDLLFGTTTLEQNRGSAGHNGVQSVMDALGTKDFWRARLGIGRADQQIPTDAFVLATFSPEEAEVFANTVIPEAQKTVENFLHTK